jgi:hypothetical protein
LLFCKNYFKKFQKQQWNAVNPFSMTKPGHRANDEPGPNLVGEDVWEPEPEKATIIKDAAPDYQASDAMGTEWK